MKDTKAFYLGWQLDFEAPPFPLFNIKGGSLHGSTVSVETLKKYGIEVPSYPPFNKKGGKRT